MHRIEVKSEKSTILNMIKEGKNSIQTSPVESGSPLIYKGHDMRDWNEILEY